MKTRSSSLVIGFLVVFGTSQVWAQAAPAVAAGSYECWGNGSARPLMNLKVSGKSSYSDSEGKERGSFVHDPVTGSITFKGGHLDGVMPSGFTSVYHETHKKPTISFRSGRGAEASFCERVGK